MQVRLLPLYAFVARTSAVPFTRQLWNKRMYEKLSQYQRSVWQNFIISLL
jgi:hypothetical protein